MAYDPNSKDSRPDLRTTPVARRSSGWMTWVAILAVVVIGAFVWSQMGGAPTDATSTSSTTAPAAGTATTPPAAPADTATPAPATPAPATGGTTTQP
jgi:hypothetical protein